MSSTNKTTYYELPQFVDNDIFNPLVDDNDAYSKIDTALHNIADAEADDASEIVGIKSRLDGAEGDIDALEAQNGNSVLTTTAQTLSGAVNELDADVSALDGRLDIVEDDINNASTGLKVKVSALETQNGSEVLTTTAQTLSGAVNELDAIATALQTKAGMFKTVEDYEGASDTAKIQSAFDALSADNAGGVLIVTKMYTLEADIDIKINTNRGRIFVVGAGEHSGFNMNGHKFTSTGNTRSFGGASFAFLRFNGIDANDVSVAFDCDHLIRLHFVDCLFYQLGTVFKSTTYMQETNIVNCRFDFCNKVIDTVDFFKGGLFNADIEEPRADAIVITGKAMGTVISACVIEGCGGVGIKVNSPYGMTIDGCYFEEYRDNTKPVIDLSEITNGSIINISNCYYQALDDSYNFSKRFIILHNGTGRCVNITGNKMAQNSTKLCTIVGTDGVARYLRMSNNLAVTHVDETQATGSTPVSLNPMGINGCTWYRGQQFEFYASMYMGTSEHRMTFPYIRNNLELTLISATANIGGNVTPLDISKFSVYTPNTDLAYIDCDATYAATVGDVTIKFVATLG